MRSVLKEIKLSSVLLLLLGSAILAFGLYNIHSVSNVTEGGIFRVNASFGILAWHFTIGFGFCTDGIMLFLGMEIAGETFSCIFFYFVYWLFCFL